ncbi:HYC_CC_PP family protein, partial [Oceanihabitans sediminis]
MKQLIHKIVSLSMAIVVLFSTMSFTIDMHFCGDTLMDTAIFQQVKTCGMDMENPLT